MLVLVFAVYVLRGQGNLQVGHLLFVRLHAIADALVGYVGVSLRFLLPAPCRNLAVTVICDCNKRRDV